MSKKVKIKSERDGSKPWYDADVSDDGVLTVTADEDEGISGSVEGESVEIPTNGFVAVSNDSTLVTDGAESEMRSKLAWHDKNGNLCVLEFEGLSNR